MANVTQIAMVDVTLIRPLNKGQGHSFWHQSIPYMRLQAVNSNFCSRTHRLATIHCVTDDDRRQTYATLYHKCDRQYGWRINSSKCHTQIMPKVQTSGG